MLLETKINHSNLISVAFARVNSIKLLVDKLSAKKNEIICFVGISNGITSCQAFNKRQPKIIIRMP